MKGENVEESLPKKAGRPKGQKDAYVRDRRKVYPDKPKTVVIRERLLNALKQEAEDRGLCTTSLLSKILMQRYKIGRLALHNYPLSSVKLIKRRKVNE